MLKRAYSLLTVKQVSEEKREISGTATTPTADRYGDIVESEGAEFSLPLPLLSQHNAEKPVGQVTRASVSASGIEIVARLVKPSPDDPQSWSDRLEEAWADIKSGLVRGLSIGFSPIEWAFIEGTGGIRWVKWDWLELSAVTIPANAEATIQTVKSIDRQLLAASGRSQHGVVLIDPKPGVSGITKASHSRGKPVQLIPRRNT